MNKIILLGLRDLKTDEIILPMREYEITLIAERVALEKPDSFSDEEEENIYKLKISHIDKIKDLGEAREVKFEKGKTPSQKLRLLTENKLGREDYASFINYLMGRFEELSDDYINLNNK